jgi:hypothetical protein
MVNMDLYANSALKSYMLLVLWCVMLCSLSDGYLHFDWTWCIHLQESYKTTGHHITEPILFDTENCEQTHGSHNLKLHSPSSKSQLYENLMCKVCR